MIRKITEPLGDLYEADETAWLEAMSDLVVAHQLNDLDCLHLGEYLADMAKRDRREVKSRLTILIAHVLKWMHQSRKRTKSWRRTVVTQRQQLASLLDSGTLRNHAEAVLGEAFADAVEQAIVDTGLDEAEFPAVCPWSLEQLMSPDILNDE